MIIDIIKVTKETEQFYLSGLQKGKLNISLMNPVNNNIIVILKRENTFDKTLSNVFTKIKIYLDNLKYVTIHDGDNNINTIANDLKSARYFINYYKNYSFRKYLAGEGISGDLVIT